MWHILAKYKCDVNTPPCPGTGAETDRQQDGFRDRGGGRRWRVRTARITPTKPGAFVAVWKRDANGSTRPFTAEESLLGLLVFVEDVERFGVFRFTREQLTSLGYVTSGSLPGKRGFRVYPSWSTGLNPQALRTQLAQAPAFEELTPPGASLTVPNVDVPDKRH